MRSHAKIGIRCVALSFRCVEPPPSPSQSPHSYSQTPSVSDSPSFQRILRCIRDCGLHIQANNEELSVVCASWIVAIVVLESSGRHHRLSALSPTSSPHPFLESSPSFSRITPQLLESPPLLHDPRHFRTSSSRFCREYSKGKGRISWIAKESGTEAWCSSDRRTEDRSERLV
jgi:hypothetical protein